MATNHYETLNLQQTATTDEIQTAYQKKLAELHTLAGTDKAPDTSVLDNLQAAWKTLSNPVTRQAYDNQLGNTTPSPEEPHFHKRPDPNIRQNTTAAFEFLGNGTEYFKIWIVNIALIIVTLTLYWPWAKVRRERYFHRNLVLGESGPDAEQQSGFDYLGDPKVIFKGYLISVGLVIILSISDALGPLIHLATLLALSPIVPWLIVRSFRFRTHNTSYRGLRFAHDGTYAEAAKVFLGYGLLTLVSFGLMLPLWMQKQKKYVLDHLRYGRTKFNCEANAKSFFQIYLVSLVIFVVAVLSFGVMFGMASGNTGMKPNSSAMIGLMLVFLFMIILLQLAFRIYIPVATANLVWNNTSLGAHQLESNMTLLGYAKIVAVNALLLLLTLGLFWPWAQVRIARYRAATLTLHLTEGSLDQFVAGEATAATAIGDEAAEAFDFDVAL